MKRYMNPPEPQCYSCRHALKRGEFRECSKGGTGYKHIGMLVDCDMWEGEEDEYIDNHVDINRS